MTSPHSPITAGDLVKVPREPTREMLDAASKSVAIVTPDGTWPIGRDEAKRIYRTMLAGAPSASDMVGGRQDALEKAITFIEGLAVVPLLTSDDIEMKLEDVQEHARMEAASLRKCAPALAASPAHATGAAMREAAQALTEQVDHCILGYSVGKVNIKDAMIELGRASDRLRAALSSPAPEAEATSGEPVAFKFDRYINGTLMAEGVVIERQHTLAAAMREAARIASRGPHGEVPVLVLTAHPAPEGEAAQGVEPVAWREAFAFLDDRLTEYAVGIEDEQDAREFDGHVVPALSRMRQIAASAPPSVKQEG